MNEDFSSFGIYPVLNIIQNRLSQYYYRLWYLKVGRYELLVFAVSALVIQQGLISHK
jgi:hypothetical protein